MPVYEKKRVTVTLTAEVSGVGSVGVFADAVCDKVRKALAAADPINTSVAVGSIQITDVSVASSK
jgi:hypothetical protein